MTNDDLLGKTFATVQGGEVFRVTGFVPDRQIVRLTPIGLVHSQPVPMPVFFAALYMGAIVETE